MTQRYLDVNGTTVFVDDRGEQSAPALLYVHGGPGMSCYDFMATMGDELASSMRVVGVDQRGVLRSGPVGEVSLTTGVLLADFEAIRERLGVSSWTVLGHSAGGAGALDYALSHPGAVDGVVFDCPCWDADGTDRHRLPIAAALLDEHGHPEEAARCRELAGLSRRLRAADETRVPVEALGEHYQELYFVDAAASARFEQGMESAGFGEETWARGTSHAPLLEEMYVDRMPRLAELSRPSVLLHGGQDLVTTPQMIARYVQDVSDGSVVTFEESGHFCYHEEPDRYAKVVASFVTEHTR